MNNLTRAEIESMTLEQLRLAVAEYVMEHTWHEDADGVRFLRPDSNPKDYQAIDVFGNEIMFTGLPDYPREITAAWKVKEKIAKKEPTFVLMWIDPARDKTVTVEYAVKHQYRANFHGSPDFDGWGETESEAICRASLLLAVSRD